MYTSPHRTGCTNNLPVTATFFECFESWNWIDIHFPVSSVLASILEGELSQLAPIAGAHSPVLLIHCHLPTSTYILISSHPSCFCRSSIWWACSWPRFFFLYLLHLSPTFSECTSLVRWPTLSLSSSLLSPPMILLKAGFHSSLCDATGKEIGIFPFSGLCHILPV